MLAVVASSDAPLLLLDGDLTVLAASTSFYSVFQIDPSHTLSRPLAEVGTGEWSKPQLGSLLRATVSGFADIKTYEMDIKRSGQAERSVVVTAHKLEYGEGEEVRLLLTIVDVTDARAAELLKDNLLREKAILLQELQHRVANSLQIISSILLQSARQVQSEETRSYLNDAHHRILSIADVQKHLAASRLTTIELRAYFTDLCLSIGNSMIRDPKAIVLKVQVDDSVADGDVSVSLGLIVTELVINALKHAFPGQREGKIAVDYHAHGPDWVLTVADNGIGMPRGPESHKPGLGTGIVEALARQLDGEITVLDNHPGTLVRVNAMTAAQVKPVLRVV